MQTWLGKMAVVALLVLGSVAGAMAADVTVPVQEWEAMKARMNELEARNASTSVVSSVDTAMDSKFGPNAAVTTKTGKLTISGLVQVWYYTIQNDSRGVFDDPFTNGIADTNATQDNDSFRIRRTELKFTMDVNENITAVVMFDPAREAQGFAAFPSNQGLLKTSNNVNPNFLAVAKPVGFNSTSAVTGVQTGGISTGPARLLQDAYINWHGCIPYHDITVGQFKPGVGEEGNRSAAELDFAERSMLGQFGDSRDLGASLHGSFWGKDSNDNNGRFQYWVGAFDGANNYFTSGAQQNRGDTNDYKDLNVKLLVRPLWHECYGKLELGGSFLGGRHGEGTGGDSNSPAAVANFGVAPNNLNRQVGWATKLNAYASYKFGKDNLGSGFWARGEWGFIRDLDAPNSVQDFLGNGNGNTGTASPNFGAGVVQGAAHPTSRQGWYVSAGYKFSEGKWEAPCWLKPVEILGRYDTFQNVSMANLVNGTYTDSFYTRVTTVGINYYIAGNTKVQANYNIVDLPDGNNDPNRNLHRTKNDSFLVNFQVAF